MNNNNNNSAAILISGASSGLGLAFLQHYASLPSHPTIIALDTQPLPPQPYSNILFHQVDITSSDAIQALAQTYTSTSTPIKLLLHCAGVRGLVPSHVALEKEKPPSLQKNVAATESLQAMTHSTMMQTFEINTWGTFNLLRAFLPCLLLLPSSSSSFDMMPKVIILSSRMGSISANTTGGAYAYRASKAALNAVVTSFAHDVPQVQFLMLHPGRVETGLVEWMKEEGAIGVEESVGDCLGVVEGLMDGWRRDEKDGRKVSGRFVDRFGVDIAW
ncbi:aflatoxin biosynthesis ketoreductase nor-1 [Pyrenophora seminiperda CCB06]|uniref:Aflatoxin biosynthesis ketoreductase nor-1 n=1 Tax=Pyrenophora seminiperda CCB06 TaxID=1302712 RepID=A0A3M7MEN3_9PLEO|nr:aflatoxin biosynthesis ketoreductase nor-1 [Pyrenophora seminiperda CCB06]